MSTLIKVGDRVRIQSVQERGQDELTARQGTTGTVLARRIVDGSWFGYIVEFEDQTTQWFFESEVMAA